jgi:hypothetical protein
MRSSKGFFSPLVMIKTIILFFTLQGFQTVVSYIYSGDETIISSLQDLDLLFEIYLLADKVCNTTQELIK